MLSPVGSNPSGARSGYPTPTGSHIGMAAGLPQISTAPYGNPTNPAHLSQPQQSPLQNRMADTAPSPYIQSPTSHRIMSPTSYHPAPSSAYGAGPPHPRGNSHGNYPRPMSGRGQDPSMVRSMTSSGFETGHQYGHHTDPRFPRPMTADAGSGRPGSFPPGSLSGWSPSPAPSYATGPSPSVANGFAAPNGTGAETRGSTGFLPHPGAPPPMSLPPPINPTPVNSHLPPSQMPNAPPQQYPYPSGGMETSMNGMETDNSSFTMDYTANSGFLSPFFMSEDFTGWLFDGETRNGGVPNDVDPLMNIANPMPRGFAGMEEDPTNNALFEAMPTPDPMAVNAILDREQNQTLSEPQWDELLTFVMRRFNETSNDTVRDQKKMLSQGDRTDEEHPLSLRMIKTYIGSYWYHFHPQMPILHRPTFSADNTNTLLLIAIIAIGAACLDKSHGKKKTGEAADLANFLAWHLRGEVFQDKDFRSPAELWVFQALLLLEVYEKMFSTRTLHERAHIHHGTTLTLMRRGAALIGRSPLDSPPLVKGDDARNGQLPSSNANNVRDPDQWWNHWILNEGTRRTAFAAFIIDSLHATMFSHSATMVAHEMKLQLPCDEILWAATSSVEVGKLEAELAAKGIKPISFCEGLKSTLKREPVRTNAFGRTALMAGVLNVSWHMNQRDTQVRSLGDVKAFNGQRHKWRGDLTRAYDFWRKDFDDSTLGDSSSYRDHGTNSKTPLLFQLSKPDSNPDDNNIFESKTVLHHLAHMAMHMDIISCQIYAKAERLLGRATLPSDKINAQYRICQFWVRRPSARDATWYSLKFLKEVLIPPNHDPLTGRLIPVLDESQAYSARDDYLLNRPWVLYYAALIVWSYGFARHGAVLNPPPLTTYREKALDMYEYLERVGGIALPNELEHMTDLNRCLGMLWILRDMFDKCRWELLHEAAKLLKNCIDMLMGEG